MTESFSTRLNDAMALRELKQIDFVHAAEKFNIKLGKSHMSQYVSGKTVPRADIAHFLAAYLRVNEDWLMGKDVPMEEHAAILPDFASEQPDHLLLMYHIGQRSRRIHLSTSSRNGHTRERLEVLRLVAGDDACETWVVDDGTSNERYIY